jgi:putative zinc finger/helix-turn-helix YgiT family protein
LVLSYANLVNEMKAKKQCPRCNRSTLTIQPTVLPGVRNGETVHVPIEGLVCSNCGYKTVEQHRMGEFALLVSDAYRRAHGLLTSREIKARRLRLKMSQEQFAKHLGGVGVASVKRWELGQVQDAAMNTLIVLRTDPLAAKLNLKEVGSLSKSRPVRNRAETTPAP